MTRRFDTPAREATIFAMRMCALACLLLAAGSAVATEIPLRPMQAPPKQDTASIGARMADIETRLACGATKSETIYAYRYGQPPRESISLAPSILVSDSGIRFLATPRHPHAGRLDSVRVFCRAGKATIARRAGTGANDFLADPGFRSVILNAPRDEQVGVRLYGDSTLVKFSISNRERQAWRDVTYYLTNFSHRTGSLPDIHKQRTDVLPGPTVEVRPRAIDIPDAYYPEKMKTAGIEGQVVVEMLVDTAGLVRTALVLKSSGHELLDLAAVRTALNATLVPARKRTPIEHTIPRRYAERPVAMWISLPYRFVLN